LTKLAAFWREVLQWELFPDRSTVGREQVAILLTSPVVPEGGPAAKESAAPRPPRAHQSKLPLYRKI
jgi:hypothetical protein